MTPHDPTSFIKDRLAHERAKLANSTENENIEPTIKVIQETENILAWIKNEDIQNRGLLLQALALEVEIKDIRQEKDK